MRWLPAINDFRDRLRAAQATESLADRFEQLAALSRCRLGFLETLALDRAVSHLDPGGVAGTARLRLALLASSTVDQLVPGLQVAGLRRKMLFQCHVAGFNQYRQELLDTQSSLHRFAPQIVLFSLSAREALGRIRLTDARADVDAAIGETVADIRGLWRHARDAFGATVIQQSFLNTSELVFGSFDRQVPGAPAQVVRRLNDQLAAAAAEERVMLLDIAQASERDGLDAWFDVSCWLQGKLEIAPAAAPLYGELAVRLIAAQRGLSKKCLVLDLDNTLWGGTVGDDGIEGIVLGAGSPTGEAHAALQHYAKLLQARGVILAICSKNDPRIAEEAFRDHPEMVLKWSDIACFVANWDPKPRNLELIAARLNLGLDGLVFLDDNPVERAAVRDALPMVAVPELPDDPAQYARTLADAGYFESVAYTDEDLRRNEQYLANASRDLERERSGSMDDFLQGLDMTAEYGLVTDADLPRVTQLINKTNQFNPTTRRYAPDEVRGFAHDPRYVALKFRLRDRFGDNGLVSAMILRSDPATPEVYEIDTWVMSCRVFGRQLESEALNVAAEAIRQRGGRVLRADYIPTARNAVVSDLYPNFGFQRADNTHAADGTVTWELALDQYDPRPTHIKRRSA